MLLMNLKKETCNIMDRRELIRSIAILTGATMVGADFFLSGCTNPNKGNTVMGSGDVALLDEIAEAILPATPSSPGAKEAKTGEFIAMMIQDCLEKADQDIITAGLAALNETCQKAHGKSFMDCSPEQRHNILLQIDAEAAEMRGKRGEEGKKLAATNATKLEKDKVKNPVPNHYFSLIKSYTLLGFFTSEVGQKKAMRFNPIPGRYEGCIPYKKGDRQFSGT